MAIFDRAAGILLHPTSLPGSFGIGELGHEAHDFAARAAAAGAAWWQILPLGPTGYGNAPYSTFCSAAGNPLLVSIELLLEDGLLKQAEVSSAPEGEGGRVDFDALRIWKMPLLRQAFERFGSASIELKTEMKKFRASCGWLEDYALFMAIKDDHDGASWSEWDGHLRNRSSAALRHAREHLADGIDYYAFQQFIFYRQWNSLHKRCEELKLKLLGDVPIFVAYDSSDVWAHQKLFHLDEEGQPLFVAGVPPDYFCRTGQLWGNPLYRWDAHKKEGYAWWLNRLAYVLAQTDAVRVDHFRAFSDYWEIPAGSPTAESGKWQPGPADHLLAAIKKRFPTMPLIAEDLGTITQDVHELRDRFALPGMRVLQFGFSGEDAKTALHQPHNFPRVCAAYTGTHDNDTVMGWFYGEDQDDPRSPESQENERHNLLNYMGELEAGEINWKMIRLALASVASTAVIPLQDILGLGCEARMNRPGIVSPKNWSWRLKSLDLFDADKQARFHRLCELYGRV